MGLYPAKKEGSPLTMKRRTSRWKEHATDLAFDLAGSFLMGVGVYTFALKGGFATGGLSGMALIINYLWGLPVGMVTLALNVPLVLLTWRTLGRGFFLKSLRTMVISTVIIDFVLPLFPVYEGSRLLAAGFSGVLMGAGLSLIYMRGSSTGGSDFLIHAAKRKAPHISFGNLSLAIDASVILLGIPAFGDIDAALYGMVSAFALTIVMDKIIYGAGSGKLVLVITNEGQAVSRAIDPVIDAADPIDQSYYMEVGSPGLGRRLTRPEHFGPYVGQKIAARLIRPDESGNREIAGLLRGIEGQTVTVETENGPVNFELAAASFVKLCDDEDLF